MQENALQIYYTANNIQEFDYYAKMFKTIEENGKGLMELNVNRGGKNTFGFVYEYKTSSAENIKSLVKGDHCTYEILNNNGPCDMIGTNTITQETTMYQLKATGMKKSSIYSTIKPENYPGQTMMTPLENNAAASYVTEKGGISQKSLTTRKGAEIRADIGKIEGKLTNSNTAPIIGSVDLVKDQIMATTAAGIKSAANAGVLAAGMSIGKNVVSLCEGNKDVDEAIYDVVKETGKAIGAGFTAGATGYAVAGLAAHSAAVMTIVQTASNMILSCGPLSVVTSIGTGPLFLCGIAVGLGISLCSGIMSDINQYKDIFSSRYDALHEELLAFRKICNELDVKLLNHCGIMEENITEGFNKIALSIQDNNFDLFVAGMDTTLNEFNQSVIFKDLKQFDEFFYNDEAVLEF